MQSHPVCDVYLRHSSSVQNSIRNSLKWEVKEVCYGWNAIEVWQLTVDSKQPLSSHQVHVSTSQKHAKTTLNPLASYEHHPGSPLQQTRILLKKI